MYPKVEIDLAKIKKNTNKIVETCKRHGAKVIGVTKVCAGMPEVARAMLAGGVDGIGDSRLVNIKRMREDGIKTEFTLLRSPLLSQIKEVIELVEISLNSEYEILSALSQEAVLQRKIHKVILMVDLGDRREGVCPKNLFSLFKAASSLPGIRIIGIGTNLACFAGVLPTVSKMKDLVHLGKALISENDEWLISGGNSSAIHLLEYNSAITEINHWRVGESILLGKDIVTKKPLANCYQNAFRLKAEIIEIQEKPCQYGQTKQKRALVALGRQDIGCGDIIPYNPFLTVVGVSSDHLAVIYKNDIHLRLGDIIDFQLDYASLLALCSAKHVELSFIETKENRGII